MSWIGVGMAAVSVASSMASNAAIEDAAGKSAEANKLYAERDMAMQHESLSVAARGVNNEVGMMLSNLVAQGRQANATVAAQRAETNVYGNTAARQQAVLAMKKELTEDNMIQQADSKMEAMQTKLTEASYGADARHAENMQSYNNMMSQQQSTLGMAAGAFSAGVSGHSLGSSIIASKAAAKASNAAAKAAKPK